MRRYLLSALTILLASAIAAPAVSARQATMSDKDADFNGDGQVSLTELRNYNRDHRPNR